MGGLVDDNPVVALARAEQVAVWTWCGGGWERSKTSLLFFPLLKCGS